jgi:hypothetical protein
MQEVLMKKAVFWMLVVAGLAAAVVLIRKRRSDLELEEWDTLAAGPMERASDAVERVKEASEEAADAAA